MTTAIRIQSLTKSYRIYSSGLRRIRDELRGRRGGREFVALDNITTEFPTGEVIAILGRNGSGKSTLLKIITGITTQTSGTVEVNGRVSAMLELTAGFDPELTGIQNIYLKALSMGIPRKEIDARIEDIIAFADIGEHIDQPVRTYSSGMKSRLGFAVSVNVDPDILVVDEVLAVGDDVFRLKCIDKMDEFRKAGKTILFVSHSMFTVKAFCTRAIWLNNGKLMAEGELGDVIPLYEDFLRTQRSRSQSALPPQDPALPKEKRDIIAVSGFRMLDADGTQTLDFKAGEDITFEFGYTVKKPIDRLTFCFTVRNAEMLEVFMADKNSERNVIASSLGEHRLTVRLKSPNLMPGTYHLSGEIWNNDSGFYVSYSNKRPFRVVQDEYLGTGIAYIEHEFQNE